MSVQIYNKNIKNEVIEAGEYLNYQYYIVSYGTHPCCYIKLKRNDIFYKKDYDKINLSVHGGLTFSHNYLWCDSQSAWYIGWDYAHFNDFILNGLNTKGHKWTLEELQHEVRETIEEIDVQNKIKRLKNE